VNELKIILPRSQVVGVFTYGGGSCLAGKLEGRGSTTLRFRWLDELTQGMTCRGS
jgi:hypothetical protein